MPRALVTGPTAGIGRSFAEQLAARGYDLVLVSRDADRLERVAGQLRATHRVDVEVLPADLSAADLHEVEDRLADDDRPVDLLVNNAGFGLKQDFLESDADDEDRVIAVMVRAPMRLTHAALPGMVRRGHGGVVVVSSVAGLLSTGPYSAAKAWALTFTESLVTLLDGTGVRAMAMLPGYVRTEFHERSGVAMVSVPSFMWLRPDPLVDQALHDLEVGRTRSVTGIVYRVAVVLLPGLPRAVLRRLGETRPGGRRRRRRH